MTEEELKKAAEHWKDTTDFAYSAPIKELAAGYLAAIEERDQRERERSQLAADYETATAELERANDLINTLRNETPDDESPLAEAMMDDACDNIWGVPESATEEELRASA